MDWENHAEFGERQDELFREVRDQFPELSDEEFRNLVVLPISSGLFGLSIEKLVQSLPEDLQRTVLRELTGRANADRQPKGLAPPWEEQPRSATIRITSNDDSP